MPGEYLPPVVASLTGDTSDFDEAIDDAKEKLDSFNETDATATLDLDDEEAQATYDEMSAQLDDWDAKQETATLSVDDEEAMASILELDAQADEWGKKREDASIGISDTKWAEAMAQMTALTAEIEVLSAAYDELAASADAAANAEDSGGGGGMAFDLGDALGALGSFLTAGLLGVAIGIALTGLIAIVQGLSFAIGGLVTMFSIALPGALAFAAMAFEPLEKVITAITAGTQLTGPLGTLETAILGIKSAFDQMEALAQPTIFAALINVAQQLDRILPTLAPLFTTAAAGFQAFMDPILKSMENNNFTQFIGWMSKEGVPVASAFGTAVANIGIAWANWMQAFGPALPVLEGGLKTVTKDWKNFAESLQKSPAWNDNFLKNGEKDLAQVGIFFKNLGNAIGQLFLSIGPNGPVILSDLNHAFESMAKILTPLLGPLAHLFAGLATDLGDFLVGLSGGGHTTTKNFGKLITQLGDDAKKSGPEFRKLGEDIGDILGPVSQVFGPLATLVGLINKAGPTKPLWDNILQGPLANITADSSKTQQGLLQSWAATGAQFEHNINSWMKSVDKDVAGGMATFADEFTKVWSNVGTALNNWMKDSVGPSFHDLPGNIVHAMSGMAGTVGGFFVSVWDKIEKDVTSFIATIVGYFSKLPGDITKAVGNISIGGISLGSLSHLIPGLASGGPVLAGVPYIVGENGPELRVFSSPGAIVPNGQFGRGITYSPSYNITLQGTDPSLLGQVRALLTQHDAQLQQQLLASGY
jgi:hypothetical protein